MLRFQLKSKIHRALVTDGNVHYEGSITIPADLLEAVDLWEGERVLVASISSGARLETYVQVGPAGSGKIVMNGAAARLIQVGDRVTVFGYALAAEPLVARRIVLNEQNQVIDHSELVERR
ncbi:MAG: aspartate 1-decarboxylase [Candidatus Eiseniibacteriota bacterium]|jgi:aspartate 1-decarboxylase